MKTKIIPVSLFGLLFLFFAFGFIQANGGPTCPKEGLVPCGTEGCPCELCDFFVMIDRIIDFLLFKPGLVPILAALMIAIGGGMYILSFNQPANLSRAKSLFTAVVIGLLIIYGAWLLINTFLMFIGVADWTGLKSGWWQIKCD
jgi:hypothetical protein